MSDEIMPALPTSPFDAIRHKDAKGEHWFARELATLLDYALWQNFERVIKKAMKACEGSGNAVLEHFIDVNKAITGGHGAQQQVHDYRLTRYACYLIAQNADPSKEIVALAQSYFAIKTREQELGELIREVGDDPFVEVAQRIAHRQELTEANKQLMTRARDAGVITSEQCARFMNWGYKGLYAGETEDAIHARKGLKPNQAISDWMGMIETIANVLRAIIARRRLEDQGIRTPRDANRTHYLSGQAVREFLAHEGILPEQLPTPTKSYKEIVREEYERMKREEEDARGLWAKLPAPQDTSTDND